MKQTREVVGEGGKLFVEIEDDRDGVTDVQVTALVRNILNDYGIDWHECVLLAEKIQTGIADSDYISDDLGQTWVKYFVPHEYLSRMSFLPPG